MGARGRQGWAAGTACTQVRGEIWWQRVLCLLLQRAHFASDVTFLSAKYTQIGNAQGGAPRQRRGWQERGYSCNCIFNSPCPLKSCVRKQLKINYLPSPERTFCCCSWSHQDTQTINPRLWTQVTQPIKQLSAAGPGEVLPNIPGEDNYSYLIWLWNEIIKSLVPFCKFSSS